MQSQGQGQRKATAGCPGSRHSPRAAQEDSGVTTPGAVAGHTQATEPQSQSTEAPLPWPPRGCGALAAWGGSQGRELLPDSLGTPSQGPLRQGPGIPMELDMPSAAAVCRHSSASNTR